MTASSNPKKVQRRARRRSKSQPMQGWGLIVRASTRLGIWEKIAEQLTCRAFALALRRVSPGLETFMRAEELKEGGVLYIRALNSAAINDFHYVNDIALNETNKGIERIDKSVRRYKENAKMPPPFYVKKFVFSVGPLRHRPDANEWERKPKKVIVPMRNAQIVDPDVVESIGKITNTDLRHALYRLYSSVL